MNEWNTNKLEPRRVMNVLQQPNERKEGEEREREKERNIGNEIQFSFLFFQV